MTNAKYSNEILAAYKKFNAANSVKGMGSVDKYDTTPAQKRAATVAYRKLASMLESEGFRGNLGKEMMELDALVNGVCGVLVQKVDYK